MEEKGVLHRFRAKPPASFTAKNQLDINLYFLYNYFEFIIY